MGEDYATIGDLRITNVETGETFEGTTIEGKSHLHITGLSTNEVARLEKVIDITASDTTQTSLGLNLLDDNGFTISLEITDMSEELKDLLMPNYVVAQGSLQQIATILAIMRGAGIEIISTHLEQTRTHRKKRINKKWAKRHGYTCAIRYKTRGNGDVD